MVDILEAIKVSWRRSMSSMRTEIESFILKGLNKLEHRLAKCINVEGVYIEM
jgi:hypothetical protein